MLLRRSSHKIECASRTPTPNPYGLTLDYNVLILFSLLIATRSRWAAAMLISPSADLHDVWSSGQPLGVECKHCQHRALISKDCIGARNGSLQCVDTLRFRCTKCGQYKAQVHTFLDRRSAKRFKAEYR